MLAKTLSRVDSVVFVVDTVDGRHPAPLSNHGKPFFVDIYREFIIPGFLRWCRISSIHSMSRNN